VTVIDDYAHHRRQSGDARSRPRARAASAEPGPVWVVFQPHTRNRTARLLDEFAAAFAAADAVFVAPIYEPVGREGTLDVSGADWPRDRRPAGHLSTDLDVIADHVALRPRPAPGADDGCGDVERVGRCCWRS